MANIDTNDPKCSSCGIALGSKGSILDGSRVVTTSSQSVEDPVDDNTLFRGSVCLPCKTVFCMKCNPGLRTCPKCQQDTEPAYRGHLRTLSLNLSTPSKCIVNQSSNHSIQVDECRITGNSTPLVWATRILSYNPEFVETLLQYGADPNLSTREGMTALFATADGNNIEIAGMLIEKGADVNAENLKRGFTALYIAVETNHYNMAKFLIERGANVNAKAEEGWTPLHRTAMNRNYSITSLLIANGADVNAIETYTGTTPLSQAIGRNYEDIIELLKKHGARPSSGNAPVTVESLAKNGIYCNKCDKRFTINQVLDPYVSNREYIGFKCRNCGVQYIYNPEKDRCIGF